MRSLSDVGVPGHQVDVLNGGDVDPTGRLLSVAEIQQAFRDLRQRREQHVAPTLPSRPHAATAPEIPGLHSAGTASAAPHTPATTPADAPHTARADVGSDDARRLGSHWTAVIAAHSGAGASCVALALADALAAGKRACRLIEAAHPSRSGLVAAATAELGVDPTGAWRRGSRDRIAVYRRAGEVTPTGWPAPSGGDPVGTIVDLGLPAPGNVARLKADRPQLVVVCRVTVPGVRLAEQLLSELGAVPTVVAAVGPGRWPGEVTASLGPGMRRLRDASQIVTVPEDRRLQVTGPTTSPLPKPVAAAGRALLGLIDAGQPGCATTPAQRAPRKRGTTR